MNTSKTVSQEAFKQGLTDKLVEAANDMAVTRSAGDTQRFNTVAVDNLFIRGISPRKLNQAQAA